MGSRARCVVDQRKPHFRGPACDIRIGVLIGRQKEFRPGRFFAEHCEFVEVRLQILAKRLPRHQRGAGGIPGAVEQMLVRVRPQVMTFANDPPYQVCEVGLRKEIPRQEKGSVDAAFGQLVEDRLATFGVAVPGKNQRHSLGINRATPHFRSDRVSVRCGRAAVHSGGQASQEQTGKGEARAGEGKHSLNPRCCRPQVLEPMPRNAALVRGCVSSPVCRWRGKAVLPRRRIGSPWGSRDSVGPTG